MAPGGISTIVEDERVRHQLQTLRQSSELSQEDVAGALQWSVSKVLRVENGQVGLKFSDAQVLLGLFGTDKSVADSILSTVRANRVSKGERMPYRPLLPHGHLRCLGYEAIAAGVRIYAPLSVPDILQTSDYARVHDAVFYPDRSPGEIELAERLRKERAAYLLGKHGPPLQVVINEAALHRPERGPSPAGEHGQYSQLRTIIAGLKTLNFANQRSADSRLNPNIHIQVQPFSDGRFLFQHPHEALSILDIDNPPQAVVYAHNLFGQYTALTPPAEYQRAFKELSATLPGPEYTNDMLDALLASLPD